MIEVKDLPAVNAVLNSVTTLLLIAGITAILRGNRLWHERLMKTAFITSTLFLVGYLVHKFFHGPTSFQGQGAVRVVYFTILLTHTVLAVVNLPLILRTFYLSLSGRLEEHKRLARWTFPIWMYVSVTGVLVYLMLYQWYR
jgi:putative membrane protein